MQNQRIRYSSSDRAGPGGSLRTGPASAIAGALALIAGGVVIIAALFVSALVFSLLLVAGAVAGGWFWWKTRGVRRSLRERMAQMQRTQAARASGEASDPSGQVLDGDFIRETDGPAAR